MSEKVTEQQILQYILAGGDVEDLIKSKNVGWKNLLKVIVKNPDLISATQAEAERVSGGLNLQQYDPTQTYTPEGEPQFDMNPVTAKYVSMGPKVAAFADEYFGVLKATGNNPTLATDHDVRMKEEAKTKFGMSEQEATGLVQAMSGDRDAWMKEEIQLDLGKEKSNYQAFQQRRKDLDLAEGQTVGEKVAGKYLGFEELSQLPSPKATFEEFAKSAASRLVRGGETKRQKKLESLPVSKVDRFIDTKADKALQAKSAEAQKLTSGERSLVEASYKAMAQKLAGKGGTPYTQAIKKLLPVIAAKKGKL